MSDWIDNASDLELLQTEVAIERARTAGKELQEVLQNAAGHCLNCEEPLEVGRFCDADCREDFQKRLKFKGR
jgi:hypothetical protein